jgi:epoxide hydrolase-like predicted phosphatase
VLTTSLREAFHAFCEREGIDVERLREALRAAYGNADPESLIARFETGRMEQERFERELAEVLSADLDRPIGGEKLIARMLRDLRLDHDMIEAVRAARRSGIRTALLSNSWGVEYYPHELLAELFDEIVISGQVGLRKPDAAIFRMATERIGLSAGACVFVDDFPLNVEAAEAAGMRGVLHEEAGTTIRALEELLGVPLSGDAVDTL